MRTTTRKTMRAFLCRGACARRLPHAPPVAAALLDAAFPADRLATEFTCIDAALADRLLAEVGHGVASGGDPKALTAAQVMALHRLFAAAKFDAPAGDCLSPAGEYNLRLGVVKELRPELVATYCGAARGMCLQFCAPVVLTLYARCAARQGRPARARATRSWWRPRSRSAGAS